MRDQRMWRPGRPDPSDRSRRHRLRRRALLLGVALTPLPAVASGQSLGVALPYFTPELLSVLVALSAGAVAVAASVVTARALWTRKAPPAPEPAVQAARRDRAEALLAAVPQGLYVFREDGPPESFGGLPAAEIEACLLGPGGPALRDAIARLVAAGAPFAQTAAGAEGQVFRIEGRPAGPDALVTLAPIEESPEAAASRDNARRAAEADRNAFEAMLDALPVPVWRRNGEGRLVWANVAYALASGAVSREDALARQTALESGEAALAQEAAAMGARVAAKRNAVVAGGRRALEFVETPFDGGALGVALDATEGEEAKERLQRYIDGYAETLDRLATAVAIFGPDRRLTFHNRAYRQLFGLDEAFLEREPSEGEIFDRLRDARRLPEQADFPAWKRQRAALYTRAGGQGEETWSLPDGQQLRVVTQLHPFGGLIYLFEDVSRQIELESSYNTLIGVQTETLDKLHEGCAVFGPDGRLRLSNAAFAQIWRVDAAALSGEAHISDVVDLCGRSTGEQAFWETLRAYVTAGEARDNFGDIHRRNDGRVIAYAIVPLPDGATLLSFLDVTDRYRVEEALNERAEALEAADRLKSEFVGHMSYQLRAPLTTIIGFAEIVARGIAGPLNAKQAEYLGGVLASAGQLSDLVSDILDLATIEAGKMELALEEVDLATLLKQAMELMEPRATKAGLDVVLEVAPDAGALQADPKRLKQIAVNLIANAFNFTPAGGRVTLGAAGAGGAVRLWVADTGPGIPPEYQPAAFGRFASRPGGAQRGAGLGLALVNRFVDLHGGWVSLESEPGQGTRVTCHLPRTGAARRLPAADPFAPRIAAAE